MALLQVLVWLGCATVVLLGIITLQIGLASAKEKKGELIALGYIAVIIGLVAAVICYGVAETQVMNTAIF